MFAIEKEGRRSAAAATCRPRRRAAVSRRLSLIAARAAAARAHDRGPRRAHRRQHADLRLRDLAADLLRAAGPDITRSFTYTLVIALGSPIGCALGAFGADFLGRRRSIIGCVARDHRVREDLSHASPRPALLLTIGFLLIVSIYVQVAMLFGVYTPELFPTEVRLRANGICNTLGRGATIVSPFIVVTLLQSYGVGGVLSLDDRAAHHPDHRGLAWGIEPAQRGLEELAVAKT